MIDNVNKFAVCIMKISAQRDFKSEYLFRTCYAATNLATSLEFDPIHCATVFCPCGQSRSSYVAIPFILCVSAATSRATGDYVTIPLCFGQIQEPTGRNDEGTRERPSLFPKVSYIDALTAHFCNHDFSVISSILF